VAGPERFESTVEGSNRDRNSVMPAITRMSFGGRFASIYAKQAIISRPVHHLVQLQAGTSYGMKFSILKKFKIVTETNSLFWKKKESSSQYRR
jgi:hypothetical protein